MKQHFKCLKTLCPEVIPGSAVGFDFDLVSMIPDMIVMLSVCVFCFICVWVCFFPHRLAGLTGSHSEGTWQNYFAFVEPLYSTS